MPSGFNLEILWQNVFTLKQEFE